MAINDVSNFKKIIWDRRIQRDLNKSLVAQPLARFAFSETNGATRFKRPIGSNVYATTYTAETAMTAQGITSTDEYLDVDQTRSVYFFVDDTQKIESTYELLNRYGGKSMTALKTEMDGKFFQEVDNAFYTVGKLDIQASGANTDGIEYSTSNIIKTFSYSKAKLVQNDVDDTTPSFVVLEPLVASVWEQTLTGTGNNVADTTLRNGYMASSPSLGLDFYRSNNLKHTITLTSTKNLAASDKITIAGVSATLKAAPAVAGEVDLGADEATTLANLAAYFNGTGTAGTTYIDMSQDDRAKLGRALVELTVGTHKIDIVTAGYKAVTEDVDSGTAYSLGEHQCHTMMGQKGCVDMVIQKNIASEFQRGLSKGLFGTYVGTWTKYGIKTFTEGKQQMLEILFKMG